MPARVVRPRRWIPLTATARLGTFAAAVVLLGAGAFATGTTVSPAPLPTDPAVVGTPDAGHGGHPAGVQR